MTVHAGRVVARLLLGAAMLVGMAGGAAAQMAGGGAPPPRSPAVFGGAQRAEPGVNNVNFSASVLGGYDTNVLASEGRLGGGGGGLGGGTGGAIGSSNQTSSTFAGGGAQLTWQQQRARVSYFGNVGGQYRTLFDIDDFDVQAYDAGGGFSSQLSPRATLSATGMVGVQPFYRFGVLGGFGVGSGGISTQSTGQVFTPDFQAAREQVLRYGAQASYGYQLSQRTTFSADVSRNGFRPLNTAADRSGLLRLGSTFVAARLQRRLTENLGARVGYGYGFFDRLRSSTAMVDEPTRVGFHNIDVGLDYSRALTLARRTSFSFGTGSNITRGTGVTQDNEPRRVSRTQFNVTGFATLQREFLRTWAASANYMRGTSYIEGVNRFGVFDAAAVSVAGLFTDRIDASAALFYTTGGLTFGGERISNTGAGAQLRYAVSPNVATFISYTYARFNLPPEFMPQNLDAPFRPDRQGVRVGLTVWLDLLR